MKRCRRLFFFLLLSFSLLVSVPITASATGDGNIDNGGGGLGQGSDRNFWRGRDEGVRVTIVRASDGVPVSQSIDLTNKQPDDIGVHFVKVCKTSYVMGTEITVKTGGYKYINPAQSLPQIISTSSAGVNIEAIKSYFTDEQVIRSIAGYLDVRFSELINGDYKLLLEPIAYVTFEETRTAFTATEAAKYDQFIGGLVRRRMPSLSHKNLPLAMFLEIPDLGYPAWDGPLDDKASDEDIISSLGLGIVRFTETDDVEVIAAEQEYRVNTDVITSVTVSGGQADPDHPVSVFFQIDGRTYPVTNVYYPDGGSQLVWVKWRTPAKPRQVTIQVNVYGGGTPSRSTITANIVDMNKNPPPNPVADDRNNAYQPVNAVLPNRAQKTSASWSIWRTKWHVNWVWQSSWNYYTGAHSILCPEDCTSSHGYWQDNGWWVDKGWWDFYLDYFHASLSADMELFTDEKAPTAKESTTKSGYGVNIQVTPGHSSSDSSATTAPQTVVSYFPEFYYKTYWRLLDQTRSGYYPMFEFKSNEFSTYRRRTHFTPVWFPDGTYRVYSYVMDCWTPDGMLCMNLSDSVGISGSLWDDWHIAPVSNQ